MFNSPMTLSSSSVRCFPRRRLFAGAIAAVFLVATSGALAGPAEVGAARRFVEGKQAEIDAALRAKGPAAEERLVSILDGMLDYEAFAKESLGAHADGLSAEQRLRFQTTLEQLIRASYRKNLRAPEHYQVAFSGDVENGAGAVVVGTEARHRTKKREEPLKVDYVVGPSSKGLRVRDIVTGGVSLVTNYRRQFGRIIAKKGFDGLMQLMDRKLKQG